MGFIPLSALMLWLVGSVLLLWFAFGIKRKEDVKGVSRFENVGGAYVPVKRGVLLDTGGGVEVDSKMGLAISAAKEEGLTPVVTSAIRPEDKDSLHSQGLALDFRSRHLSSFESQKVADRMQKKLGNKWDVIAEFNPPHIHVEYDPAR